VPWCPTCDRFLSPPTVTPEGACPQCGRPVEAGRARPPDGSGETPDAPPAAEEELPPIPLHMKVLGASMVVYLGYRFLQGVEWVVHQFS
jgi:hypothetical protein